MCPRSDYESQAKSTRHRPATCAGAGAGSEFGAKPGRGAGERMLLPCVDVDLGPLVVATPVVPAA